MKYNFDTLIDREGTNAEKFDARSSLFGRSDVIPLWVADLDFATPPFVADAIIQRAKHPLYGYTHRPETYYEAVAGWLERRNAWKTEPEWMDFSPGVVAGIVYALKAFTEPGDGVVIQPPVYHPFAHQIRLNGRRVITNPLVERSDGSYGIDFEDLDQKLSQAKVFLLCNPHNPTGRVFTYEELYRIGTLCIRHNVLILSDEIHCDIIYAPHRHLHLSGMDPAFARCTVTFTAPSKTFNLAGLSTSVVITPNEELRSALRSEMNKMHADQGNIFGMIALETAYTLGDEWLDEMLDYLDNNARYVLHFLEEHMPQIHTRLPEGTYLMWLDLRGWPLETESLYRFLVNQAGLGVSRGDIFGEQGKGWVRMNIGSPRSILQQALEQLDQAARHAGLTR